MALIETKCTNCGASINVDNGKEYGFCTYCGTKFIVEKTINNTYNNVTNVYNIQNANATPSGSFTKDGYYKFLIDKSTFERTALISLAKNPETPRNIFEADFIKPNAFFQEYWKIEQEITANWSASIGYYREETYVKYTAEIHPHQLGRPDVTKKQGVDSTTRRIPENQTRTVTDWSPLTGKLNIKTSVFLNISGKNINDISEISSLINSNLPLFESEENTIEGITIPSQRPLAERELNALKIKADEELSRQWKACKPGDTQKNFSATMKADSIKITRYFVPFYITNYSYNNALYSVSSNAVKLQMQQTFPKISESANYAKAQVKKALIPVYIFLALFCACILCGVIANAIGASEIFYNIFIYIGAISLIALTVFAIIYMFKYDKVKQKTQRNILNDKLSALNEVLLSRGLASYEEHTK